jgi:hypothetical protein
MNEVLIIKKSSSEIHAEYKHLAGSNAFYAINKLRFENIEDANYFIEHYKGQLNYKEALPLEKEVTFEIELKGTKKFFWDKQYKPANWVPVYVAAITR